MLKRVLTIVALIGVLAVGMTAHAGDTVLTNNTGTASTIWFISGEASLVINGFDLTSRSIQTSVLVDRISISVRTPRPGVPVEAVIYEDADGGSPRNAALLARKTVTIDTAGVFNVDFDPAIEVKRPFLWVGFYLPVDFEFRADTQGSSVLTYWGWTPGGTFDLANLASAAVFGPSDGSAPVNITMNGVARITAEIVTDGSTATTTLGTTSGIRQIVGDPNTDLSVMAQYPVCSNVTFDSADVVVTYQDAIDLYCREVAEALEPAAPAGYKQRGPLYDVYVFRIESGLIPYPYPITHCVRPRDKQVESAVIGLAYGAPREWRILPTVRFGAVVCAELTHAGFVSLFTPR